MKYEIKSNKELKDDEIREILEAIRVEKENHNVINTFNILKRYKDKEVVGIEREYFKVEDAARKIKLALHKNKEIKFSDLLHDIVYKVDVITYFLGMLELIKNEYIYADQSDNFADILIKEREYNGQEQAEINN